MQFFKITAILWCAILFNEFVSVSSQSYTINMNGCDKMTVTKGREATLSCVLIDKSDNQTFINISSSNHTAFASIVITNKNYPRLMGPLFTNLSITNILNLQSNLGLSPLFICLNSTTSIDKKKAVLELFVKYDAIDFKVCSKDNEDIYDICKKHNLLDFFLSILKED
jgi:hypothetical protein